MERPRGDRVPSVRLGDHLRRRVNACYLVPAFEEPGKITPGAAPHIQDGIPGAQERAQVMKVRHPDGVIYLAELRSFFTIVVIRACVVGHTYALLYRRNCNQSRP